MRIEGIDERFAGAGMGVRENERRIEVEPPSPPRHVVDLHDKAGLMEQPSLFSWNSNASFENKCVRVIVWL